MRRALLLAAAVIPVLALAAVTATTGQLLEVNNFNAAGQTSYINLDQCTNGSTSPLSLEWNIQIATNATFTSGNYRLFASDTAPTVDATKNLSFCPEANSDSPTTIRAGSVGNSVTADNVLKDVTRSGRDAVTAAGKSCDLSNDGAQIWLCAHWTDTNSNKNGSAFGKFTLQFTAPDPVANVSVGPGDTKLRVSWDAVTTGATTADHYEAQAFQPGQGPKTDTRPVADTPAGRERVTGTSATISGLTNGQAYDVYVIPFSIGGNPGAAAGPVSGTPLPSADFWDVYKARGGVEQGGCASGSAGTLALLGVASLAALRRRKP